MDECIVSVLKVWTMDNDAVLREVKYKMINDSIREPVVGRIQMSARKEKSFQLLVTMPN